MAKRSTNRQKVYGIANEFHGIITIDMANKIGVPAVELRKLAQRGALERVGAGVYRVPFIEQTAWSEAAAAVSLVGHGAFIFGESVLSLHNIGLFNPRKVLVGTYRRFRRSVPGFVRVVLHTPMHDTELTEIRGVLCESVYSALCNIEKGTMADRFSEAVEQAFAQGHLTKIEYKSLVKLLRQRNLSHAA